MGKKDKGQRTSLPNPVAAEPVIDPEAEKRKQDLRALEKQVKEAKKKIKDIFNGDYDQKMKSRGERMEAIKTLEVQIEHLQRKIDDL